MRSRTDLTAPPHESARPAPTVAALFLGFLHLGLISFGGAVAWARRLVVERRGWLSGPEFVNTLSLSQLLPGAPGINLAVVIGARSRGVFGASAAVLGFVGIPLVISLVLANAYAASGDLPWIRGMLAGLSAAVAGMLISLALKIIFPLLRERPRSAVPFIALTFAAVALVRLPLGWTLVVLAPASIAIAWRLRA